jgi:NADH-quinone oxidoreductase subunit G
MPMPTFKIDGKEVPYEDGDTILMAAYRAGIDIPYYCWHPGLSVAANCRMCLVEILPPPGRPAMMLDVLELDKDKGEYVVVRKPKLQPACQVPVTPNLEVLSETSPHVARARHAVQEFLLLNHPVDCPICDQAGECKLQDYWLEHMRTSKRMHEEIIHKPKGVSFGPTIVYDAERCIVCTRCVRFCSEVVKDPVLSKRERGNLGEIIVAPGRQLDHAYTLMTEHVCPVGALTSKDFRFKARVWFLRSAPTICQGCATGCNAWLDFDPRYQKVYRHRPRDNKNVNQYWMCDEGMLSYAAVSENRVASARVDGKKTTVERGVSMTAASIKDVPKGKVAVLLSAQHSNEDNFALVTAAKQLGFDNLYVTGKAPGEGDDVLRHPDKNPNTAGVTLVAGSSPKPFGDLLSDIDSGSITHVLALGSAVPVEEAAAVQALKRLSFLAVVGVWDGPLAKAATVLIPACSWAEGEGTFVNAKGMAQRSAKAIQPVDDARPAWETILRIVEATGETMPFKKLKDIQSAMPAPAEKAPEKKAEEPSQAGEASASN